MGQYEETILSCASKVFEGCKEVLNPLHAFKQPTVAAKNMNMNVLK
jgi:hypothetical protein